MIFVEKQMCVCGLAAHVNITVDDVVRAICFTFALPLGFMPLGVAWIFTGVCIVKRL